MTRSKRGIAPRLVAWAAGALGVLVSPTRDHEILRWICRHGVVNAELVGRRFFWRSDTKTFGKWAAYRRLRILGDLGLVLTNKPIADLPAAIRVTREGARLADVGLRPAPLVVSQLRHTFAVVVLSEYLLAANPGADPDNGARTARGAIPRAAQRQPEDGRRTLPRRRPHPALDGIEARPRQSRSSWTSPARTAGPSTRIIRAYDHEKVDAVWWFVAPSRIDGIKKIVQSLNAEDRIELRPWRA